MNDYTDSETNMIFTEDLKNVIFLVDNNDTHLDLLIKMLKKYFYFNCFSFIFITNNISKNRFHSQNQSLRFGTFIFGPIVMRLIHNLGDSDLAIKLFKDPVSYYSFNSISNLIIVM
jgi:pentatricopeptide repeat domain-containing protein 2